MLARNAPPWLLPVGVAVGAVGVAAATAWAVHRALSRPDCKLGPDGGTVAGIRYIERIRGNADPDQALPMVILFHSRGATPEGYAGALGGIGPARLILPQGNYGSAGAHSWWSQGVKAAVKPENYAQAVQEWDATATQVEAFIDGITRCRPTVGKPIVTGSSMGGEMALLMASEAPRKVHGAVAVSSYLLEPFWNKRMAPAAMIHGTGDEVVPYQWALEYADSMSRGGAPIIFDAFESSGHAVTKAMGRTWTRYVREMADQIRGKPEVIG